MDKQYLAGFFDGSGNISIQKRRDKRAVDGFTYLLMLSMIRVNGRLFKEIKKICKTKIIVKSQKKGLYRIQIVNLRGIRAFLEYAGNNLISKKQLAKEALDYCRSRLSHEITYSKKEIKTINRLIKINRIYKRR